jgi:hypothetical protein
MAICIGLQRAIQLCSKIKEKPPDCVVENKLDYVENMLYLFNNAQNLPFFWMDAGKSLFMGMYLLSLERDMTFAL